MKRLSLIALAGIALAVAASGDASANGVCGKVSSYHSKNSNTPTSATFINKTPEARTIIWIDFKGHQKIYTTLQPNRKWTVSTFVTHVWMVTDGPGNCYGIYVINPGNNKLVMTEYGDEGGD